LPAFWFRMNEAVRETLALLEETPSPAGSPAQSFCVMLCAGFSLEAANAMDYIWTPWRYQYMAQVNSGAQPECIFCDAVAKNNDAETLIAYRGAKVFVILNRYPYTSGHVMIVPYAHVAELNLCEAEALKEMMQLAQRVEKAFRVNYKPDGMNLGMNLGRAAGAGVTGHLHLHALPRWIGDSNFMTVTGETRVHPEDLRTTYDRLRKAFL
jgi:ATP adenylyltransferase